MPGIPFEWNINLIGAWNLAILTPDGISRRLFGLAQGVPIEVEVSVNQPGAIKVNYENLTVIPQVGRLLVGPTSEFTAATLGAAGVVASRALTSLPETPLSASGVNIRFNFATLTDKLIELMAAPVDDVLADAGFSIGTRMVRRSVAWHSGMLNVEIHGKDDSSGLLGFNFHRGSQTAADHVAWLAQIADMHTTVADLYPLLTGEDFV